MFLCEHINSEVHLVGLEEVRISEKQCLIVRIARSIHSQVLKNRLNDGELHEIHILGICKKKVGLESF